MRKLRVETDKKILRKNYFSSKKKNNPILGNSYMVIKIASISCIFGYLEKPSEIVRVCL
jgi:hypothetical protein